jgi:hypothetical protein
MNESKEPLRFSEEDCKKAPILRFFEYSHLPERLKDISRPFAATAALMLHTLPDNEERAVVFRKLLEAKDCAVRAAL